MVCSVLLAVGLSIAVDHARAVDREQKALIGVWELVETEKNGRKVLDEDTPRLSVCFTGREYLSVMSGTGGIGYYTLSLGGGQKALTMTATAGKFKGEVRVFLYELEGDTLQLTGRDDDLNRYILTLKRVNP